ncbi:MAG: SufS family cysteine desulfurase, partial [Candidatus Andersenbacteria bacterium]|nr:SufS family cysteine desulfurase [Candidatus Andersenbacteria bacterium]
MDLNIKGDFPIFKNNPGLVFLDNAATTQKPGSVINAEKEFYETTYANIHRAMYDIAAKATEMFEGVRGQVGEFIGAHSPLQSIIFTRNASEALNLAAYIEGQRLQAGDEILVSVAGHHSNILPWMRLAGEKKLKLTWIEVGEDGRLDIQDLKGKLNSNVKVVAIEHVSNVLGYVNPIKDLCATIHEVGARVVVDAAQSSCRMPIDVQDLNADYVAFSGHKMYGPTGSGWLYAKKALLEIASPLLSGGGTVKKVTRESILWADSPWRFEAGTPDIASVIGLGATLNYLSAVGMEAVWEHDQEVMQYGLKELNKLPFVKLFGPTGTEDRAAIFSFVVHDSQGKGIHPHDVAEICNSAGVAIRGGHHCAQPLMQALGVETLNRASVGMYNTPEDIDRLVEALLRSHETFV